MNVELPQSSVPFTRPPGGMFSKRIQNVLHLSNTRQLCGDTIKRQLAQPDEIQAYVRNAALAARKLSVNPQSNFAVGAAIAVPQKQRAPHLQWPGRKKAYVIISGSNHEHGTVQAGTICAERTVVGTYHSIRTSLGLIGKACAAAVAARADVAITPCGPCAERISEIVEPQTLISCFGPTGWSDLKREQLLPLRFPPNKNAESPAQATCTIADGTIVHGNVNTSSVSEAEFARLRQSALAAVDHRSHPFLDKASSSEGFAAAVLVNKEIKTGVIDPNIAIGSGDTALNGAVRQIQQGSHLIAAAVVVGAEHKTVPPDGYSLQVIAARMAKDAPIEYRTADGVWHRASLETHFPYAPDFSFTAPTNN